ncbi:MAG: glycosyltransferase, partial [Planctomycetota bacterium]
DMRVEPDFLRELVGPVVRKECSASTGKMMSWDGKVLNSAGGGMNFHGIGIQRGYLEPPHPDYDKPMKTLFACGGAMAIDAKVYADIGGFDDEFFAYYEDVDMGWRMWVLGHEVHYAPKAVCYHHHSSTSGRMPREMIRLLQVRNPVYACFKNYGDEAVGKVMPALLSLAVRRAFMASGLDPQDPSFRIEKAEGASAGAPQGAVRRIIRRAREVATETVPVKRTGVADLYALNDFLGRFDYWKKRRDAVQERRQREDQEIFALFRKPEWCIEAEPSYEALHEGSLDLYGVRDLFRGLTQTEPEPRG